MPRFKQFTGSGEELESSINAWLEEFEPDVTNMVQTTDDGGAITISFLFDESFRGQDLRFRHEHGLARKDMQPPPAQSLPDKPIKVAEEPGHLDPEAT
jgi:hypothetical protein